MKKQGLIRLFSFVALIVMVGLACNGGPTPTPIPVQPQPTPQQQLQPTPQQEQPTPQPQPTVEQATQESSGGLKTFTDQNKYFEIDIPSDWAYTQTVDSTDNNYYIDTFASPDELALVENIVYDDGTAFSGSDKARFALYLLNTFYSKTGKEGDIRVSDDRIMDDGSERLTWTSKGNGASGISFLETRGSRTFLFFTVEWVNSAKDLYLDTLNQVVASYK